MPPKRGRVAEPDTPSEETISDEEEEEFDLVEAMNQMPKATRGKVYALKHLQSQYRTASKAYRKELAALELAFLKKTEDLLKRRRDIVCGACEPSEAEVRKGIDEKASKVEEIPSDDEADSAKKPEPKKKGVTVTAPSEVEEKDALSAAAAKPDGGIPHFWLTAMKNNEMVESQIFPRDEAALKYLTNVETSFIDDDALKGFQLTFTFAENPFFTNKTLTKKVKMDETDDDPDQLDSMEGCDINWTSTDNKLTVVMKQKKQRHKGGKGVRVVQREEPCPSFFHFFDTVEEPEDDADEEAFMEFQERMEVDAEIASAFRTQLVPRAVHYYSGKAIEEIAAQMQAMNDAEGDDEEDDEEFDEEEEEEKPKKKKGGRGGGGGGAGGEGNKPPPKECKQQ